MRTVYIADDGKEFDNEFDCEHHEWMLNHPNLKYIKIYDNRTGELFDDIMTDDAYNYGDKVVIPTEFALKDLHYQLRRCDIVDFNKWELGTS